MKTLFACMAALALIAAHERAAQAAASVSVSVEFFYDSLAPYGDWVEVEGYGHCFRPSVTLSDPGWRPYTEGSWIRTDAGWTWGSDEDFGWATYHYGRWFLIGGTWFWQPGETWGPAWVSWRAGDEVIGWATLPPEATWQPETGFNAYVDADYNIGPGCYSFVPIHRFGELRLRKWLEPWQRNVDFMRETVNCTNITHRKTDSPLTAVFNEGPDLERVAQLNERGIRRMKLAEHDGIDITDPATRLRNWSENDQLRVIAPRVQRRGNESAPKLVRHRFNRTEVNHGWEGFRPETVEDLRSKADKLANRDRTKDVRVPKPDPATAAGAPPSPALTPAEPQPASTTARAAGQELGTGQREDKERRDASPTASAIQEPPPSPTTPREGEATSRPGPGEDRTRRVLPGGPTEPDATSERRTRPDSELRKPGPVTSPGADVESKAKGKAIPNLPDNEPRPVAPDRFRTEPQDAPPRSTQPKLRSGVLPNNPAVPSAGGGTGTNPATDGSTGRRP
jgi:hypothetical protein